MSNHRNSTQRQIFNLIKQLSGQSNVLTIPRAYIGYTGDVNTALVLSQLIYWCDKGSRNDGFIYKSYREWAIETGLSKHQINRATQILKSKGIVETQLKKAEGAPTLHYRLDIDRFTKSFSEYVKKLEMDFRFFNNPISKRRKSLTETTTEITPKDDDDDTSDDQKIVFDSFQENIGEITPAIQAELKMAVVSYSSEWVVEAIRETVFHGGKSLSYVLKTLDGWEKYGFKVDKNTARIRKMLDGSSARSARKIESEPDIHGFNRETAIEIASGRRPASVANVRLCQEALRRLGIPVDGGQSNDR